MAHQQFQSFGMKRFACCTRNFLRPSLKVLTAVALLGGVVGGVAQAHLMVAQHGTLNFLDDSAYLVLSLPASAFIDADDDKDGLLSITEFSEHRRDIIAMVAEKVTLGTKTEHFELHNIMVSPVTPHDAPKDPADQIIVMGRFSLAKNADDLFFRVDLFGESSEARSLEITAARKSNQNKQVFELTPVSNRTKLNFN